MLEFLSHRLFLWDVWAPRVIFSSLQPETIEMEDVPCSSFNNLPWTITLNSLLGLRRYHRPKTESRDLVRAGTEVSYFHMKQFLSNISFHLFLLSLLSSCHGLYCGSNCLIFTWLRAEGFLQPRYGIELKSPFILILYHCEVNSSSCLRKFCIIPITLEKFSDWGKKRLK